jgi:hypothetical protein
MNKRGPRPRGEEDRAALGIQRVRFLFILSAVDSKPASDGRIKTSHFFFRLNPAEMFWQGMI